MEVMIKIAAAGRDDGKSGGGPPQSKTLRAARKLLKTRSVLECASPLALYA
jgi:hypothetical protein